MAEATKRPKGYPDWNRGYVDYWQGVPYERNGTAITRTRLWQYGWYAGKRDFETTGKPQK